MARVYKPKQQVRENGKLVGYAPSKNWFIEYHDHTGKRRRESIGPDEKAAGIMLSKRLQEVALESAGIAPERPEPQLSLLISEFLTHTQTRVSENTFKSRRGALQRFSAYFKADPKPSRLSTKIVGEYLDYLVKHGLSADSANVHLSHIRSMLEWGYASGEMPTSSPAVGTPPLPASKKKIRPRRALNLEECARLQKTAEGEMLSAVLLGLYAGLRIDEIGQIQWRDMDLENGLITIRAEVGKNGKEDVLPLHTALVTYFSKIKQEKDPYPLDKIVAVPGNPYRPLYRLLKKAGVDRTNEHGVVDWHALRHTYLTMAATGADAKELQMLARHANPATTLKIYVHTDTERMRQALKTIPDLTQVAG